MTHLEAEIAEVRSIAALRATLFTKGELASALRRSVAVIDALRSTIEDLELTVDNLKRDVRQ